MRFLYDAERKLFGVGYAVGGPREFGSHYDLLASECRLASLVAIAKGDVPAEHWFALSRPYSYSSSSRSQDGLLSWSGTMFEYLMPLLFTRSFTNSMLDHACRDAVERQIEYGNANNSPVGDFRIGLQRARFAPDLSIQGFRRAGAGAESGARRRTGGVALLQRAGAAGGSGSGRGQSGATEELGLAGPMGFYESIDFSRESAQSGARGVVIYCYMAHHQGMSLAALDNVLHRDAMQRRFHGDLRIRSVETLLFEGIPITRLPMVETEAAPRAGSRHADRGGAADRDMDRGDRGAARASARQRPLCADDHELRRRLQPLERVRRDALALRHDARSLGQLHLYPRSADRMKSGRTSHKPLGGRLGETTVRFAPDRAEIRRRVSGIETILDITVASEDDAELRRLRITNRSLRTRQLEFTSYVELAMTPHAADKAHPAFAKMFVETECPEPGVLIAHRRPRRPGEPPSGRRMFWSASDEADGRSV